MRLVMQFSISNVHLLTKFKSWSCCIEPASWITGQAKSGESAKLICWGLGKLFLDPRTINVTDIIYFWFQACLGIEAKANQKNVIQVTTTDSSDNTVTSTILSLTGGKTDQVRWKLFCFLFIFTTTKQQYGCAARTLSLSVYCRPYIKSHMVKHSNIITDYRTLKNCYSG